MANRPGQLCVVRSGKSIGAQKGFAETFNWLAACISKIKAGKGVKLSWPAPDTPEISLDKSDEGDDEGGSSDGVQFEGTDESRTDRAADFTFASASDSNVVATCDGTNITIGVYYT